MKKAELFLKTQNFGISFSKNLQNGIGHFKKYFYFCNLKIKHNKRSAITRSLLSTKFKKENKI
jgi:hypothetical protein